MTGPGVFVAARTSPRALLGAPGAADVPDEPVPSLAALQVGAHRVHPPVVLAPMAGITTKAFRLLCREQGAGLYVSEMITARALLERHDETMRMIGFDEAESPRSVQLYAVAPEVLGDAVRMLVKEDRADHIDLNFGCPVPKVTRKGGGAALPWKRDLLRALLRAAVRAADGRVPVTMKTRMGIDEEHLTYLDAGRIAVEEGVSAIALHARTAAQAYSGEADWSAIARLKDHVPEIPVLGNGDIWSAEDALRMVRETRCDGVVVGRGCLGRPQLFAALAAAFAGRRDARAENPGLAAVAATMNRHAELLAEEMGVDRGVRDFRKHVAWYLKGFSVGSATRDRLAKVSSREELADLLAGLDLTQSFPEALAGTPRGRTGPPRRVALPEGWLDSERGCPELEESGISGG